MLKKFFALSFLFSLLAQAENIKQVILQKNDWNSAVVENHRGTGKTACMAFVSSKDQVARLEVYAEASAIEAFIAPMVQVSMASPDPRQGGSFDSGKGTTAFPASITTRENKQLLPVYMSALSDREKLIQTLISGSTVRLNLQSKSQGIKVYEFSLKGSEAVIKKAFETCKLKVGQMVL